MFSRGLDSCPVSSTGQAFRRNDEVMEEAHRFAYSFYTSPSRSTECTEILRISHTSPRVMTANTVNIKP